MLFCCIQAYIHREQVLETYELCLGLYGDTLACPGNLGALHNRWQEQRMSTDETACTSYICLRSAQLLS